jgi:hypothetical protein
MRRWLTEWEWQKNIIGANRNGKDRNGKRKLNGEGWGGV